MRRFERLVDEWLCGAHLDRRGPVGEEQAVLRHGTGVVALGEQHRPQVEMRRVGVGLGMLGRFLELLGLVEDRAVMGRRTRFEFEPPQLGEGIGLRRILGQHLVVETDRARRVALRLERLGLRQCPAQLRRRDSGPPTPSRSPPAAGCRTGTPPP